MATVDNVLRATAAVLAVGAVAVVAANPQFRANFAADARNPVASDALQREADSGKGYTFLLKSSDSRYPGRWCGGTIRYTLDLTRAQTVGMDPATETARWARVLQNWSAASGGYYRFEFAGDRSLTTKDDGQLDLESIESGTIGITYVTGADQPGDATHRAAAVRGRTAGNGGLQVSSDTGSDGGMLVGDKGFVMIDADDAVALDADGLRQALYQHESGHALGLGHVDSRTSIMNGTLSNTRLSLAPGDVAGLRALTQMPCSD
ncbi:MAG: matrixin family metalloprotease [Candidatus Nanopelagicales bacterium]